MRLVVESGVLFQRALREIPRVPTRIAFPVIGPVMQLVLLTAVLTNVTQLRGYPASSSGVPRTTITPRSTIASRSHSRSASSR